MKLWEENMRQFIPNDYIDKEGNVYETVGENIRYGKNGAITSVFPTPEEIGTGGFVGSDGTNYAVKAKNLADTKNLVASSYVLRFNNGEISYEFPISTLSDITDSSTPPMSKAVVDYVGSKLPYLKNAKTGIVVFSVGENGSVSIKENPSKLDIYTEVGSSMFRILSKQKNKNIIDLKILKCTTDSTSNFNLSVDTQFSVGNNSLYKVVSISKVKTITILLSVEV